VESKRWRLDSFGFDDRRVRAALRRAPGVERYARFRYGLVALPLLALDARIGCGGAAVSATGVQRVTLTPIEAASALGISRDFFDKHVKPELKLIRRGRLVLVPVRELERWAEASAARVLE
jgi:excisionase family DNA binding protein